MSFWLTNPIKLIDDVSVIPKVDQPLAERMNTLTRLVIIVAIVFYLFKYKGSTNILIFGVFAIIILYYSQREKISRFQLPSQKMSVPQETREYSPYTTGERKGVFATAGETQAESFYVDPYSGRGDARYRQYPVIPPSFAAASDWGGQESRLNIASPMRVEGDISRFERMASGRGEYAQKISYSQERPRDPRPRDTRSRETRPREPRFQEEESSEEVPHFRTFLTPGVANPARLPFSEQVDDRYPRDSSHVYHVSRTDVGTQPRIGARINEGGGLAYSPAYQGEVDRPLSWDPSRVGEARTLFERSLYPSDADERTGAYRSRVTGYTGRTAGGYQQLHDLPGYNMYYAGPKKPFEGLFATTSEQAHADVIDDEGNLYPRYFRTDPTDEDLVEATGNRQLADELMMRESLDATYAGRLAETDYEMRLAPMRRMK